MMARTLIATLILLAPVVGCSGPDDHAASRPASTSPAPTGAAAGVGWRGDGTGRYPKATPPTEWDIDEGKNLLWQAEVGAAFSMPVIAADRLLLTSEPETLLCVRRSDGKVMWRRANGFKELPPALMAPEKRHSTDCGFSTPTPASDGERVWAGFGTGIVVCYDLDGVRKWVRHFDRPQMTAYGRSASPVLAGGRLLVSIGHLTALDPATGETIWQAPKAEPGYGTPAIATIGETLVAITPNGDFVRVADGKILAAKVASTEFASPVVCDGVAYFAGEPTIAVELPTQAGETIAPKRLWETEDLEGQFYASPVVHEGIVYCVNNDGTLYALKAGDGSAAWRQQLEIPSGSGIGGQTANIYPSIALAGKHLYVGNDAGTMLVLAPGGEYKQISENYLDEGSGASPAFAGKHIYLRDGTLLRCTGTASVATSTSSSISADGAG